MSQMPEIETRQFEEFLTDLMDKVDPEYREGFEQIIAETLKRERAFHVVVHAIQEDLVNDEVEARFKGVALYKNWFENLSNLSLLCQLIDICGLSLYKDDIVKERIKLLFGTRKDGH